MPRQEKFKFKLKFVCDDEASIALIEQAARSRQARQLGADRAQAMTRAEILDRLEEEFDEFLRSQLIADANERVERQREQEVAAVDARIKKGGQ
jgi:hypothetical protein